MRTTSLIVFALVGISSAQVSPYDVFPDANPPYYRVCYAASAKAGELSFPVTYTIWIPSGVENLRGVIVHQHGCGEGSCKSGLTGAYDLHWQALAKKHGCALMSPSYGQPEDAACDLWCDPRKGSDAAFQNSLVDLGRESGHPELATVPWALWGHSGGGTWAGTMTLLHPERVAAAWLRSGSPAIRPRLDQPSATPVAIPDDALAVPIMLNPGTQEGVTVKDGRFAGVWPRMEQLFVDLRTHGGVIGAAVDPLTGHECGNQRYLAIPWFDACLTARLPVRSGDPLRPMPPGEAWLAPLLGFEAFPDAEFAGERLNALWLPNETVAKAWMHYVRDTEVPDTTQPPAPTNVRAIGREITWDAEADLESGIAHFVIERNGKEIATVPEESTNPFGRAIFQGLQYSDTPIQPLVEKRFTDISATPGGKHSYRVIAVNTMGLRSE